MAVRIARGTTKFKASVSAIAFVGMLGMPSWASAQETVSKSKPAAADTRAGKSEADQAESTGSDIVVTGTNIKGRTPIAPITKITREDIEKQGFTDLGQVLRSIPGNFGGGINPDTYVSNVPNDAAQSNRIGASSPNLLGLGSGATLTLVNGHRLPVAGAGISVDLALIPLVAVDRVDVLADGASAIYGTDAVAGVVNVITRRDFDGVEARARIGGAAGGLGTYTGSVLAGHNWGDFNATIGVEYFKQDHLLASERSGADLIASPSTLVGDNHRTSIYASANYSPSSSINLYVDALYMQRYEDTFRSTTAEIGEFETKASQYAVSGGARFTLSQSWSIDIFGTANSNRSQQPGSYTERASGDVFLANFDVTNTLRSVEAKATGSLVALPAGPVQAAFGIAYRNEKLRSETNSANNFSRNVKSAYAEVNIPIFGEDNNVTGIDRLTMTAAGRLDDYTDAGSVAVPKVAIEYKPISDLAFGASYSESFRAPSALDSGISYYGIIINTVTPGGTIPVLHIAGTGATLKPERSKNLNFSAEYKPGWMSGLRLFVSYYNIKYKDRIANPDPTNSYTFDITRAPPGLTQSGVSQQELVQLLSGAYSSQSYLTNVLLTATASDIAQVSMIFDARNRNISATKISGIQGSVTYNADVGYGAIGLSSSFNYIDKFADTLAPGAPSITRVGTIFSPPRFKSRTGLEWNYSRFGANLYWNYASSYRDTRVSSDIIDVRANNTFDIGLTYDLSSSGAGPLSNTRLVVNVANVLNSNPPRIAGSYFSPARWDSTNASIIGRFASIELVTKW